MTENNNSKTPEQERPNGHTHNRVKVIEASGRRSWKWELKK